jgi:hypothetical protein
MTFPSLTLPSPKESKAQNAFALTEPIWLGSLAPPDEEEEVVPSLDELVSSEPPSQAKEDVPSLAELVSSEPPSQEEEKVTPVTEPVVNTTLPQPNTTAALEPAQQEQQPNITSAQPP